MPLKFGSFNATKFYVGSKEVKRIYLGSVLVYNSSWTPLNVSPVLWLETDDLTTIILNGSNVSQWNDKSGNGFNAVQGVLSDQPLYNSGPPRITFNTSDRLISTLPATVGTLVIGTTNGTVAYTVNIPSGNYQIGRRDGTSIPDGTVFGYILSDGVLSSSDIDLARAYIQAKGSGDNYGSVTDFTFFWYNWEEITTFPTIDTSNGTNFYITWNRCSGLTSFPLLDTSSGLNFSYAWSVCSSLTSFPLIDTSAATNFFGTWGLCTGLTSFPALNTANVVNFGEAWDLCSGLTSFPLLNTSSGTNFSKAWNGCTLLQTFPAAMFDTCAATNFTNAFANTALTQSSIDNILVSINTAGTSSGTFNQSGGNAPSTTGQTAIDALRGRGWTVTVTGGY